MRGLILALLITLIVLIVGLGGFAGYCFITQDKWTPFTETVLFVMALVGLLVALTSLGIWVALRRILHEDIAKEISRVEEATRNEALSRMAAKVADSFWGFYEDTKNEVFRDQAIKMISDAREILEGREKVDREKLKCRIYNNLAFAYAESGEAEKDTATAHFLANYVRERIKDYPDREVAWLETYAYVLYRLPRKHKDKEQALDIIRELLERPDMTPERKDKLRQRYSISDAKEDQESNPDKSSQ